MQAIIVMVLIVIMEFYNIMEGQRNSMATESTIPQFKASSVASNLMQYSDMLTQYAIINYDQLHLIDATEPGKVENISTIDYNTNNISDYSQKNLKLFLNYTSAVFNYAPIDGEFPTPILYLVISWDSYAYGITGYSKIPMTEIMGAANQLISKHMYQGDSVNWVVPILLQQDGTCNMVEAFGQIPNDNRGVTQIDKVRKLFNLFCTQVNKNSAYKFQRYVYLAPIILTAN